MFNNLRGSSSGATKGHGHRLFGEGIGIQANLPVYTQVQAFDFHLLGDAYLHEQTHHKDDNRSYHAGIDHSITGGENLQQYLMEVAVNPASHAVDGGTGEYTGQNRTKESTDGMYTKGIQCVIITEDRLDLRTPVADDAGGQADDRR